MMLWESEVDVKFDLELLRDLLSDFGEVERVTLNRADLVYCYLYVEPDHARFWEQFRSRFDPGDEKATRLGARLFRNSEVICPEFPSAENLIEWLIECTGDNSFCWVVLAEK